MRGNLHVTARAAAFALAGARPCLGHQGLYFGTEFGAGFVQGLLCG
jgi:hypothetical protein